MKIIAIEDTESGLMCDENYEIKDVRIEHPTYDLIVKMTQEEYNEMIHALFKYREELLTKEKGD